MKRELFENVKVIPGGTDVVIDRTGFLSAVFGANVTTTGTLKVKLEHADAEDGEFAGVDDPYAGVDGPLKEMEAAAGSMVNIDIDLLGCKNFVKITVEGTAEATCAVVLGDPAVAPV